MPRFATPPGAGAALAQRFRDCGDDLAAVVATLELLVVTRAHRHHYTRQLVSLAALIAATVLAGESTTQLEAEYDAHLQAMRAWRDRRDWPAIVAADEIAGLNPVFT